VAERRGRTAEPGATVALSLEDFIRLASVQRDEIQAARARIRAGEAPPVVGLLPLLWESGVGPDVSPRTAAPVTRLKLAEVTSVAGAPWKTNSSTGNMGRREARLVSHARLFGATAAPTL
jgi:hypothetical protein